MNNKGFFQTLFNSQNPTVGDAKYKFLFDNDSIVRLNTEQQQHCEGMLTLDECLAALKTFNKNKSPGTDGFTAECYLRFWDGLGQVCIYNWKPFNLSKTGHHQTNP